MNSQPDTEQPTRAGLAYQTPGSSSGASRFALVNGRIALPDAIVEGQAVVVEDGVILGLANPADLGSETERLDVGGRLITPGLIDIHIHGALGHTFNEPDAAAWEIILQENARRGVTSLVATFAPEPIPNLIACLEFARSWISPSLRGAPSAPKQSRSPATEEIASQKLLAMTANGTRARRAS